MAFASDDKGKTPLEDDHQDSQLKEEVEDEAEEEEMEEDQSSRPMTRVISTNVQYEGLRIGGVGRQMNSKVNQSNKACIESKRSRELGLLSICPSLSSPGPYI
jgi:hypothetical protein